MHDTVLESKRSSAVEQRLKRALVVVGMHRSGTSAMTRVLSLLGAGLPKNLMPVHDDNRSGFWESQTVANLNDEILDAVDSDWDDVFALRPHPYLSNFDQTYVARAIEVLHDEFGGADLLVLKDPRISILTNFWDRALKEAGYETHYVVMVRNPLEVAESLRVRDRFPREKSLLLWSSYMIAVDRDTCGRNRTFVSYDQLMSGWRAVRQRIEQDTGFPFPRDSAAAETEIDNFLDDRLRNHKAGTEVVFPDTGILGHVESLYRVFCAAFEGKSIDRSTIKRIEAEFAKLEDVVGPVVAHLRTRIHALDAGLREIAIDRDRLLDETHQLARQTGELTIRNVEAGKELECQRIEVRALEEQLASAERVRSELQSRESELRRCEEEIEKTSVELTNARSGLAELSAELADTQHLKAELEAQLRNALADQETLKDGALQGKLRIDELSRALSRAEDRSKDHEERLAAHFEETAVLSRRLLSSEQRSLKKIESLRHMRELFLALSSRPRWWAVLPRTKQAQLEQERLLRLGLFDGQSYLRKNPDVGAAGIDPLRHFVAHGLEEGRQF